MTPHTLVVKFAVAVATLLLIAAPSQTHAVAVVEYFVTGNNSYFLTGKADEQKTLDALSNNCRRTGTEFDAFAAKAGRSERRTIAAST